MPLIDDEAHSSQHPFGAGFDQLTLWPDEKPPADLQYYPSVFRPINYLGSKLRMLPAIVEAVEKVSLPGDTVCDLFSGSGVVASALGRSRPVVAADIQEYSRVLSSALLNPVQELKDVQDGQKSKLCLDLLSATEPLSSYEDKCIQRARLGDIEPLADFITNCSLIAYVSGDPFEGGIDLGEALEEAIRRLEAVQLSKSSSTITLRWFGGTYFSFRQAVQIDAVVNSVFQAPVEARDFLLAVALSSVSEIVNTHGKHFAQPLRLTDRKGQFKPNSIPKITGDRSLDFASVYRKWLRNYNTIPSARFNHRAMRGDYKEILDKLPSDVAVVYADPPYTRDHYSRYYHVLETLCLRQEQRPSRVNIGGKVRISRGLYGDDRHQSPFCIPSKAAAAFSELFERVSAKRLPLIFSYSPYPENQVARPRLLTIDELTTLASNYFGTVEVASVPVSHVKLNNASMTKAQIPEAEVLITCTI